MKQGNSADATLRMVLFLNILPASTIDFAVAPGIYLRCKPAFVSSATREW